jgi:hypothetical protein
MGTYASAALLVDSLAKPILSASYQVFPHTLNSYLSVFITGVVKDISVEPAANDQPR